MEGENMKVVILAICAGLAWGTGQILVKAGMQTVDPFTGIVIRLTTAWLVAVVILFVGGVGLNGLPTLNPKGITYLAIEGVLGPMLGMLLLLAAYRAGGDVRTAAPISLTVPIVWSTFLAVIFFNEGITFKKALGILLAIISVGLLASNR